MASEVGDLFVVLRAVTEPFKRGLKDAAAEGEVFAAKTDASTSKIGGAFKSLAKVGVVVGGAAVLAVGESVKMAASFQAEMTKLNTQAGVAKDQIGSLSNGVLQLAGQVGFSPNSLAEALFHIESSFASTGITGQKALELLKIGAEGAAIGHADLVGTVNALDAAVASGIPGVDNFSQAMGALNAIVGSGDMSMEDLNKAFGTGGVAVVKGYGLSITDVGAALATFGDNNIRGAQSMTALRMAVQSLAVPASGAKKWLDEFGMTQSTLAQDMQHGGLKHALDDLQNHFKQAGITATQQGQVLTDMFGKKAGTGLAVLMGQMDRTISKYPELGKGAHNFGDAWKTTSQTVTQKWNDLKSGLDALAIKLGTVLLPYVTKFLDWIHKGVDWLTRHKNAVLILAGALGTTLVAAIVAVGGALAAALGPEELIAAGIVAVGGALVYAYKHFKTFHTIVDTVGRFLKTVFVGAWHAASQVIHWFATTVVPIVQKAIHGLISWFQAHKQDFINAWNTAVKAVKKVADWFNDNVLNWIRARIKDLTTWWKSHSKEITEVWHFVFEFVKTEAKVAFDIVKAALKVLYEVWKVVWGVIKDTVKLVWDAIKGIVTFGMHLILNIIGIVLDLITGHWGKAWADLKKLASQALHDVWSFIKNFFSDAGSLLYDAGKNIINGLINGIRDMIGGIGNAIGDVVSEIKDHLPWSPAKKGPLSGTGSPEIGGRNIGRQVAHGLASSVPWVAAAAEHMAGAAALVAGGGYGGRSLAAIAAGGGSAGAPVVVNNYHFKIEGSVLTNRDIRDLVQREMLRLGARGSQTWQSYTR